MVLVASCLLLNLPRVHDPDHDGSVSQLPLGGIRYVADLNLVQGGLSLPVLQLDSSLILIPILLPEKPKRFVVLTKGNDEHM